jgi:VanZ family protein
VIKLLIPIYLVILCFLSLNPWLLPDPRIAIGLITWDLIDHAIAYGFLSILLLSTCWNREPPLTRTALVLLTASLIGISVEYGQYWLTFTRHFSFYDTLANIFGAVLGTIMFWAIWLFRVVIAK